MTMCVHCGREDCDAGSECPSALPPVLRRQPTAPPPRGPEPPLTRTPHYGGSLAACGEGSFVSAHVEIRRPHLVRVGKHSNLDSGLYCTTALEVGDYCHLAAFCTVVGGELGLFLMGDFSTLGAGSRVVCAGDAHAEADGLVGPTIPPSEHAHVVVAPVVLRPLAVVTTGVILLPGVVLGEGCMVGAGAVVTRSLEPWTVHVGAPARPVRARGDKAKILEAAKRLGYDAGSGQ